MKNQATVMAAKIVNKYGTEKAMEIADVMKFKDIHEGGNGNFYSSVKNYIKFMN